MELIKKYFGWVLLGLGVALLIALLIGSIFFDFDAAVMASWFFATIFILFVFVLILCIIAFICWFLGVPPWVLAGLFLGLFAILIGVIIMWAVKKPAVDLLPYLQPIFSIFKS